MRVPFVFAAALAALSILATATTFGQSSPPAGEPPSLAPMLEHIVPSVVSIGVKGKVEIEADPLLSDPFFRKFFGLPEEAPPAERSFQAAGSGVIVDAAKGYVLTNNHVVENADEITVTLLDHRSFLGKVIGSDQPTDIAVIQIKADKLTALPLGDSSLLKVGDYVVAVGNPFGLGQTVTMGIVSALGRSGLGIEGLEDFIQTDASINPGNSGGALINLKGELVGINSAIIGPAGGNVGIGFAIPMSMAKQVMDELITHGAIRRGQLGVMIQDLTPALAQALKLNITSGALVSQVVPGSPASTAGVLAGDVIVAVNGRSVYSAAELRTAIGVLGVGAEALLSIVRKSEMFEVSATLSEASEASTTHVKGKGLLSGVALADVSQDSAAYGQADGAEIVAIDTESKAAQAGLTQGDVIVSVDQQPVHSAMQAAEAADRIDSLLLLGVFHDGSIQYVVVQ